MRNHNRIGAIVASLGLMLACAGVAAGQDAAAVYKKAHRCVVKLKNAAGSGTGFLVNADGTIITNAHVVASPLPFVCEVEVDDGAGGTKILQYKKVDSRVGVHPDYDLALVKIDPAEHEGVALPAIEVSFDALTPGQTCYALGHPLGGTKSITNGVVSSPNYKREETGLPHVMSTAAVQGGNSGGPLLDGDGRVIGVVAFYQTDPRGGSQALTGCVPTVAFKDPTAFQKWKERTGDPNAAKIFEQRGDAILQDIDKHLSTLGPQDPQILQATQIALRFFSEALSHKPADAPLQLKVGRMYYRLGAAAPACGFLSGAIESDPWVDGKAYGMLGLAMLDNDRPTDDVEKVLREGIRKFPQSGLCWGGLGKMNMKNRKYTDAVLYGKVGWKLTQIDDQENVQFVSDIYFTAKNKCTDAGQDEPEDWESEAIFDEDLPLWTKESKAAKAAGKDWINEGAEEAVMSARL